MKIGARTFKTGFAIFFSVLIPTILGYADAASLSAISVVSSMQPSVKKSYIMVRDRVVANTIGGMVAYFVARFFGNSALMVGIASMLLIAILHYLNLNSVIGLSVITLSIIMVSPLESILSNAITRVLATILGVIIAFITNTLLFPPKYDFQLYELTNEVTSEITRYIRISLRKNMQFGIMRKDLKKLHGKIEQMKDYANYIQDSEFSRFFTKDSRSLGRLVVVYRQFIDVTEKAYELSRTLHRSENIYNNFSDELRVLIRERLETLMGAHEQILQKWNGRILPDEVNFIAYKTDLRMTFMKSFFNEASMESYLVDEYGDSNTVIKLMSVILEYEESLQRLNTLVSNYVRHHKNEKTIHIEDNDQNR